MNHRIPPILIIFFFLLTCTGKNNEFRNNQSTIYAIHTPRNSSQISFLNINSFCQDSLGYMWIATLGGLNRYNGYEYIHYVHNETDSTSIDHDFVFSVFLDSSNRLWAGTTMGVNRYDFQGKGFEHYQAPAAPVYSFFEDHNHKIWVASTSGPGWIDTTNKSIHTPWSHQNVNLYWEDNFNRLWMGLSGSYGLAVLRNNESWEYFSLPENREVVCKYSDPQGMWWLGTNAGLMLFDPVTQTFKDIPAPCLNDPRLSKTRINFIQEVEPLKILIGTATQGLFQYDFISQTLLYNEPVRFNPFQSAQLMSCYIDRQENIWIGSYDKGITVTSKYPDYFNADHTLNDIIKHKFVTRVIEDREMNLWISTRYDGLYRYTPDGKFMRYTVKNSDLFPDGNDFLESLFIDSKNRIWIGFDNQLVTGNILSDGRIQLLDRINLEHVRSIKEDQEGNIWLGTWEGLFKLSGEDPASTKLHEFYHANVPDICILNSGDLIFSSYGEGIFRIRKGDTIPEKLDLREDLNGVSVRCITIFEDSQNRIWMGSYGRGMLHYANGTCKEYTWDDGLPSNNVLCIQEDTYGDIWMSTSYGISKLKLSGSKAIFSNYSYNDGTQGNQFHEKAGCRKSDGRIFFAGNHGLTFFNPATFLPNSTPPVIHIEDLKISNHSVRPSPYGSVLSKDIAVTDKIILNHKQTTISIDYAGIDFLYPEKLTYKYKMEGIDPEWNYVDNFRRASYSNIPAGKYTFLVSAINSDGIESTQPANIEIIVKPAPWLSWQAWLLYFFLLFSVVYFIFRTWFNIKINRQMLEVEHNERQREKEISEMKINFFTNISHELRTPLTLISAPLEQLLSNPPSGETNLLLLNTISRNVQSMLRLINQLLDFRKVENGMLSLQVQNTDIIVQIKHIYKAFMYHADKKHINLHYNNHVSCLYMWTDTDKIEKILHNLLSNALKYTPENGMVEITTKELTIIEAGKRYPDLSNAYNTPYLEISVSDTGEGIPENKFGELFVRYRQISGPSGIKPDYSGSGIGLHYTKCLVEKHNGQISAERRPEGGMIFSFILPINDIYPETEKDAINTNTISTDETYPTVQYENPVIQEQAYTILIAEDNAELMDFIRNLLCKQYKLIEVSDGEMAWEFIQRESPDLILSDVIMPGLSGYQLCAQVKQNPEYCHIPFILLTARTTMSDQIEGLEQGADAYICKPFNIDYLLLTIKNLFLSKDRLRHYFSTPQTSEDGPAPAIINQLDQKFMDKLIILLEKELPNPDINIDYIARELGFSRTGFYKKIKGLTDMSPIDFLINYRLRRAAEIMIKENTSFQDVAELTGFSSYSYFSKSFKKHFGVSPKDYINSPTRSN